MAHDIDILATGQSAYVGREPAWHRLGNGNCAEMTAEEAVRYLGLTIERRHLEIPGIGPSKYYTILRTDLKRPHEYGAVTKDYFLVDPVLFAQAIDKASNNRPIATAGILRSGSLFLCFSNGTRIINGEEHDWFTSLSTDFSGKGADRGWESWIRTVCKNTQEAGWQAAENRIKIPHDSAAIQRTEDWVREVFASAEMRADALQEALELLNHTPMPDELIEPALHILEPVLVAQPKPNSGKYAAEKEKVYVEAVATATARRALVRSLYEGELTGYDTIAHGSANAFWQAAVEAKEHIIPARNDFDRAQAFCGGLRAKQLHATFDFLMKYCQN